MTALDKAIKIYWYSRGFNKAPDTGWYQMELDAFSEGWEAALKWALTQEQSVSGLLPEFTVAIVPSLDIRRELKSHVREKT